MVCMKNSKREEVMRKESSMANVIVGVVTIVMMALAGVKVL